MLGPKEFMEFKGFVLVWPDRTPVSKMKQLSEEIEKKTGFKVHMNQLVTEAALSIY
jgi:hypothetical protein